ncbi:MAG TPA: hypothetical protein VM368_09335, partial [Flavisolibacter sp.]|nr:hypothetical protein [Flavisolibacter sp.]
MVHYKFFFVFIFSVTALFAHSQKIVYSEVDLDDSRRMTFEVIGKVSGNFLVYKNIRNKSYVSVYNNDMVQVAKEEQSYISDRLINIDFLPFADFTYMIYQYQKKNVVYCDAVKVDGNGKKISEIMTLDTTHLGFASNNRIYSTIASEDKSKVMVFKINSRNKSRYIVTTLLMDNQLALKKKSRFIIPMEEYYEYLREFNLDNDGDLVFLKFKRSNNEHINNLSLLWKGALVDSVSAIDAQQEKIILDEPHIK